MVLPQQRSYASLPGDPDAHYRVGFTWKHYMLSCLSGFVVGVVAVLFSGSALRARNAALTQSPLPGVLPQVSLNNHIRQYVCRYREFEAPPAPEAVREPLWDGLIPDGLGYVRHPELAPNLSVVGVFHALHCLNIIRHSYYTPNVTEDVFDLGLERELHVGHCFDYLRQSLTCTIDSTVEPAKNLFEDPTWGFDRQCRDYDEVKKWAETYRAFNVSGSFVPPPGLFGMA
ncbi:hypothetical protein BDW67DRAFT_171274 [Aspergillus spinulosporus]